MRIHLVKQFYCFIYYKNRAYPHLREADMFSKDTKISYFIYRHFLNVSHKIFTQLFPQKKQKQKKTWRREWGA